MSSRTCRRCARAAIARRQEQKARAGAGRNSPRTTADRRP
jgi:hypothetical protein